MGHEHFRFCRVLRPISVTPIPVLMFNLSHNKSDFLVSIMNRRRLLVRSIPMSFAICCLGLVACNPGNTGVVAQQPAESAANQGTVDQGTGNQAAVNQEAAKLLRAAGDAQNTGDYKLVLEKCKAVIELLPNDVRVQQRAAELMYLSGHAKESVPVFDRVIELLPNKAADNWQRGIALATVGDFKRGAEQFKLHHDVNPDDVENSAWYYLCVAKSESVEAAKKTLIGSRGDRREPMMEILKMLRGDATPEQVLKAAEKSSPVPELKVRAKFYADLYIGLYYDSIGREEDAVKFFKSSLEQGETGYMADTARVYLEHRFQKSKDSVPTAKP